MTLQVLADLQRLLNHVDPDWEYTPPLMEEVAKEVMNLTDGQYSEFLGHVTKYNMMESAMKKSEAENIIRSINEKNKDVREKIIREHFT